MEIQSHQTNYNPNFGMLAGLATRGLRWIYVNPAIGATCVDVGSMGIPRPTIDYIERGPDAGVETAIRDNSGTANHLAIGTIGGLVAYLISGHFNKVYNVKSHYLFANNETIDFVGKIWHEEVQKAIKENRINDTKDLQKRFFQAVISVLQGLNSQNKDNRWVHLDKKSIDEASKYFTELLNDKDIYKFTKENKNYLNNLATYSTGAATKFKLAKDGKTIYLKFDSLMEDLYALGKTFTKNDVKKVFAENSDFATNPFVKDLKNLKMRGAAIALAISSLIGASIQPFNCWLTKKRTGKDGFVGVQGESSSDKSGKFLLYKSLAAAGMVAFALRTIGKFSEIPNKIQFKGKIPTIEHFKLIYGITIACRFLATRDKNEFREVGVKDIPGFINWLLLGGVVTKLVATLIDKKNLLNRTEDAPKTNSLWRKFTYWVTKTEVKTVDEILLPALKKANISVTKSDGKPYAFKELLELAKEKLPKDAYKLAHKQIKYINRSQVSGYLYSGIVLGALLPMLNIYMTNKRQERLKAKEAKLSSSTIDM